MFESELTINFDTKEYGGYKLLELPPELCKLVENADTCPQRLLIHGMPDDDAVICTVDRTYTVRSVVLSNTVMITSVSTSDANAVTVRDEIHDVLEVAPCLPRLHRIDELLAGLEFGEDSTLDQDMEDEDVDLSAARRNTANTGVTYQALRSRVQASDTELQHGLAQKRILQIRGCLYPISSPYLSKILELLLNTLVSLSLHKTAPLEELALTLEQEHEIKREVTTQVMSWFGTVEEGAWTVDVEAVLTQIGLDILGTYEHETLTLNAFLEKWAEKVGDTFVADIKLGLLAGNYLLMSGTSSLDEEKIKYYPRSALPLDSVARFGALFSIRERWKAEEIEPFLTDIAIDSKERDKLLLKYGRALTDAGVVWYTARAKYNG